MRRPQTFEDFWRIITLAIVAFAVASMFAIAIIASPAHARVREVTRMVLFACEKADHTKCTIINEDFETITVEECRKGLQHYWGYSRYSEKYNLMLGGCAKAVTDQEKS